MSGNFTFCRIGPKMWSFAVFVGRPGSLSRNPPISSEKIHLEASFHKMLYSIHLVVHNFNHDPTPGPYKIFSSFFRCCGKNLLLVSTHLGRYAIFGLAGQTSMTLFSFPTEFSLSFASFSPRSHCWLNAQVLFLSFGSELILPLFGLERACPSNEVCLVFSSRNSARR